MTPRTPAPRASGMRRAALCAGPRSGPRPKAGPVARRPRRSRGDARYDTAVTSRSRVASRQTRTALAQNETAATVGGLAGTLAGATAEVGVGLLTGVVEARLVSGLGGAGKAAVAGLRLPCIGNCFPAGTPVVALSGFVAIETIRVGDVVWSKSDVTGEEDWKVVTDVIVRETSDVLALDLVGADVREVIRATREHPFWVRGKGWVLAGDLEGGDAIFGVAGEWLRLVGTPEVVGNDVTYNLTVDGFHTFFVGETGAWGHNSDCGIRRVTGGAGPVRAGQAGEAAVRAVFDIGEKKLIDVSGRGRIPDGVNRTALSEVKNVSSLAYAQQLRDFAAHAQQQGLRFDLYVRDGVTMSGPLLDAIDARTIHRKIIP